MLWIIIAMYACATVLAAISLALLIMGAAALSRVKLPFILFATLAFLFSLIKGILFLWRPFMFPKEVLLSLILASLTFAMFILASWSRPHERSKREDLGVHNEKAGKSPERNSEGPRDRDGTGSISLR